jgi:microcin C transport system substrate-binding protein
MRVFRFVLFAAIIASAAPLLTFGPSQATERRHGLSAFGELKYPADFKHFDYVNPDAPKGGRLTTIGTSAILTFNSFNNFILKGDPAEGLDLLFDTLMTRAMDEPDAMYGLAAREAELAGDGRSVTFYLRPEAKFSDGSPLTAEDVVFSFNILKEKGHPRIAIQLRDVTEARAIDARTVRYAFKGENTRDLPLIVAGLPIFSKAYYAGKDFAKDSLDPPLGSGPYKISDFRQGAHVTYKRRPDYWAADLPVNKGRFNFDEIRYEYYRDRTASLEAFKAGAYDLREEFTSKSWATEYDIPQVKDGRIKLMKLPDERPSGAQGFFLNTRRDKFKDIRVREALDFAFDYEWMNKNLFYSLYKRTESYFENSDLKAKGKPSEAELKLLEPFRDKLSPEVFGEAPREPVTDGSGRNRANLLKASQLLEEAGWTLRNGMRVNAKGEPLAVEFLIEDPVTERIIGAYARSLGMIGIRSDLRRIDPAQAQERQKTYDYDIDMSRFALRLTPGPELRAYWSSDAAKSNGSFNMSGISDPVVDALIDKILVAKTREELRTACHAIDRVLRAGHYWVPQWYKAEHDIAVWDKFSWPAIKPKYDRGIEDTWWYDKDKAAKIARQ